MNIYWLGMLKDISFTVSQLMRREKEKKKDAKFALIEAKARQVTFVVLVMLGFVPHLVSDFTINHRLCKTCKRRGKSFYCVRDSVVCPSLSFFYGMSTFWFSWIA